MEPDTVPGGPPSDACSIPRRTPILGGADGTSDQSPGTSPPGSEGLGEQDYVVVARLDEVPPGTLKRVAYGEEPVVLANVDGQLYALEDECMHYGVPLSEGFVKDSTVICMWHAWRYDIPTGKLINPPSTRLCLGTYPVRVEGDAIAIGPRASTPGAAPPAASSEN